MEIRVHVSAPSSVGDDARHRARIAAILAFQPASQLLVTADTRHSRLAFDSTQSPVTAAPATSVPVALLEPDALTVSGSTSSSTHSPHPCFPAAADGGIPDVEGQAVLPRSGHDTGPAPDPQRILSPGPSTAIGPGASAPASLDRPRPASARRPRPESPHSLDSLVSVIPDSQPSCQAQQQPRVASTLSASPSPAAMADASAGDVTGARAVAGTPGVWDGSQEPPSAPDQPSPKRRRHDAGRELDISTTAPNAPTTSPILVESCSASLSPDQTHQNQTIPLATTQSHPRSPTSLLHSLPMEIHPPPPPISTSPFTTHITPTLSMLTERLKRARTYKPLHQSRELEKLERGYWALKISIPAEEQNPTPLNPNNQLLWEPSFFHRFWSFLSDFIGRDARAGWGVWCILEKTEADTEHDTLPSTASTTSEDPMSAYIPSHVPESLSVVLKVYAWGEIAMHIYLLLFLASERRIRGMGAEWRDSREEIVIRMP